MICPACGIENTDNWPLYIAATDTVENGGCQDCWESNGYMAPKEDKPMDPRFKTLEQENAWRKRLLETDLLEFWPELRRALVKTRKPHECNYCGGTIPKGELARVDTGIVPCDGMMSLYTCIACIEEVWCEGE